MQGRHVDTCPAGRSLALSLTDESDTNFSGRKGRPMILTVAEVAHAVDKNENYVRQHIHRGHLTVRREGRRVCVMMEEAVRWATVWGLGFNPPDTLQVARADERERAARLTLLAWNSPSSRTRNLFTLLRHRRRDALGPWEGEGDATWSREPLSDELTLFSLSGSYAQCHEYLDHILTAEKLSALGREIEYALETRPRQHWAYRDYGRQSGASIRSPFSTHSAAITEYWSFAREPHKRWLQLSDLLPARLQAGLRRLGFPLDQRPERVGNFVVAAAEDAIACRLTAHPDHTLRLHVDAKGALPLAYRATVWARHSGDEVLRREVPFMNGQTLINVGSEVDDTGFAICRKPDGQCVDLVEGLPVSEASAGHHRSVRLRDTMLNMPRRGTSSRFAPGGSDDAGRLRNGLDKGIRRQWLQRVAYQRATGARRQLVRFGPGRFRDAASHFLDLVAPDPDRAGPIYLADPCFVGHTMADDVEQLFVEVCGGLRRRPLRILCAEPKPDDAPPWWVGPVKKTAADVTVRTFVNRSDERGCFHDRYLITPHREVLMTNSFNGWNKYGVTFVSLPYGVYRAEAEQLWAMDVESSTSDTLVHEIY